MGGHCWQRGKTKKMIIRGENPSTSECNCCCCALIVKLFSCFLWQVLSFNSVFACVQVRRPDHRKLTMFVLGIRFRESLFKIVLLFHQCTRLGSEPCPKISEHLLGNALSSEILVDADMSKSKIFPRLSSSPQAPVPFFTGCCQNSGLRQPQRLKKAKAKSERSRLGSSITV